jgi:hypothetical protein
MFGYGYMIACTSQQGGFGAIQIRRGGTDLVVVDEEVHFLRGCHHRV